MVNQLLIFTGKILSKISSLLGLGHGSTWPGHIALKTNKDFIKDILSKSNSKVIIIAGTNGKTTSAKLISSILEKESKSYLINQSGANLLNGIASSLILNNNNGRINKDYCIFEVDENALPLILNEITPDYLIILNLFRDQLDRYGEINTIAKKWKQAINKLTKHTTLILNADDPQVAYLGKDITALVTYFSYENSKTENKIYNDAVDSIYCPNCGTKLLYKTKTYSHLGDWYCTKCKDKRPSPDLIKNHSSSLPGIYNQYNTNAVVLLSQIIGISNNNIEQAVQNFTPAFGRQEKLNVQGKQVQIFLSKNPTGFNESLRTVKQLGAQYILFVLNDRIADGKDVSWIWDTDIENILDGSETIFVSGDRVYDMALRIKYVNSQVQNSKFKIQSFNNLKRAIATSIKSLPHNETLYILPTYTAMLETRKILTGKKIL